jgi:hypothetical protein
LKDIARKPELALVVMQEMWPQIVGARMAENLVPVGLAEGCLILEAKSDEWSTCNDLNVLVARTVNSFWGCRLIERIRLEIRQS